MPTIQNSQSSGSSSSFSGLSSADQASVRAFIQQLLGGGSADYQALRAKRNANMVDLQTLAQDYTNDAAFSDAADLMALNLQNAMEKQMPAIAKAVQGAGTSSSSMQALMSNKIAQDAALASGALGAEQAKAYGNIQASMQGTLENYTRGGDETAQNIIRALGLLNTQSSQSTQQSTSSGSSTSDGGSSGRSGSSGSSRPPSGLGGSSGGAWSNTIRPGQPSIIVGGNNGWDLNFDPNTSVYDPYSPNLNSPGQIYQDPAWDPYNSPWNPYIDGTLDGQGTLIDDWSDLNNYIPSGQTTIDNYYDPGYYDPDYSYASDYGANPWEYEGQYWD